MVTAEDLIIRIVAGLFGPGSSCEGLCGRLAGETPFVERKRGHSSAATVISSALENSFP